MAAIWKGTLAFGLVNIPVELRTAVREDHIHFRLLHAEDLAPVKYERVCSADGETVPWADIVKGYEAAKGQFVVMTDEDFAAAAVESTRTLDILDFVPEDEIDPRYFETPYYLTPVAGGERAYALLREAIRRTGTIGIGKITIRQKEHLAGVRVIGDAIVLEIMRFAGELVDPAELRFPSADAVRPQELQMAEQLIGSLAAPFRPESYTDDYRERLMQVIRAKMKGQKIEAALPAARAETPVIDLMSRLRESLETGRRGASVRTSRKRAASREATPAAESRAARRGAKRGTRRKPA